VFDIVLFEAVATAAPANLSNYPTGEKHALIIFARQRAGSEADFSAACAIAEQYGWLDVTISRAALLSVDMVRNYEGALESGHSLVTFRDPVL
jgi:hypothetical protein